MQVEAPPSYVPMSTRPAPGAWPRHLFAVGLPGTRWRRRIGPQSSMGLLNSLTRSWSADSNRLAAVMRKAGAGPEICVGILMERSAKFVVAALAILKTGAAYLPIDPATPSQRAAFILSDAEAPLLISHHGKARELPAGSWRVIELENVQWVDATEPEEYHPIELDPQSLAYVIYTSGSTGRPKGVEITHANLLQPDRLASDRRSASRPPTAPARWRDWVSMPPAGRSGHTLTAGASLHIADEVTRRSPHALARLARGRRITISFVPTVLAEQLLQCDLARGDRAAHAADRGGHAAPPPDVRVAVRAGQQLWPDRMHRGRDLRHRCSRTAATGHGRRSVGRSPTRQS